MPFFGRRQEEAAENLHVVVGLGNPGSRYAGTRHNAGAMVIHHLAEAAGVRLQGSKHAAATARAAIDGIPVLLAVPDTYVNESGVTVGRLTRFFKVPPARLFVVCDDLDIPFGTIRIRAEGGSGGHNGLKSVIATLGTQDFPRMRVGVGRPPHDAIHHVLGRFSVEEEKLLPGLLSIAADAARVTITAGPREAMNRYNRDWLASLVESGGQTRDT